MAAMGEPPKSRSGQAEREELTEERTIEFDVDSMNEELLGVEAELVRDGLDGGAVAAEVEDNSTGAASPRDLSVRRARRNTLVSPIPSMLAKSMRPAHSSPQVRPAPAPAPAAPSVTPRAAVPAAPSVTPRAAVPAAPSVTPRAAVPAAPSVTPRAPVPAAAVAASSQGIPVERGESRSYSVEIGAQPRDAHSAPTAEQPLPKMGAVGILVHKARFSLDAGDIGAAVLAASAAVVANERSPEPEVGDLNDTAAGPLAPIFTAGPASKVPVMNRSGVELDTIELDELQWALLRRMNGRLTLDEVFRATKIPAIDALKIAGVLLRDGVIRVEDRSRA
jgi:hypothetical protein